MANYRIRTAVSFLAVLMGWMYIGKHVLWFLPLVPLAIAALPADHLTVKAEKNGQFWITGFGDAFIASCKQEFDDH